MLVSTKKMLEKAEKEHYAVAQININNLEWTKAVLEVSQELNSPGDLGRYPKVPENIWVAIRL